MSPQVKSASKRTFYTPKSGKVPFKNSSSKNNEDSFNIIKPRNENVIKEINISITPKHLNKEEINAGSSTTRHNLGNISICFSSPSPPGIRTVTNATNKLHSNKKSPVAAVPSS
jgi:hypothetical protein